MSAVLAPTLGFAIDRMGRNIAWVLFSCVCTLIAHCLLVIQSSQVLAWIAMVVLGIGYSTLASALWPIIALVVPLHRQGTAFGIQTLYSTIRKIYMFYQTLLTLFLHITR